MSDKDVAKLTKAIEDNDDKDVLSLIDKKVVEATVAAMKAVEAGNVDVLKAIVGKHTIPFTESQNMYVIAAAHNGHKDMIDYLCDHCGCNVSDNQFGYSPVSAAAAGNQKDMLVVLRDRGANLRENEHNTLYMLAKDNNLEMMKYVVDTFGFDIHADEEVALRTASKEGHADIVKYLKEQGASLENVGSICLSLAVTNGHARIAAELVEQGVDWQFLEDEKESLKQIAEAIEDTESEHAKNLITHLVMGQLDS